MAKNVKIGNNTSNPTVQFTEDQLESIIFHGACDLIGEELSADTLDVSVFFDDTNSVLRDIPYATPIFYNSDNNLIAKLYIEKIERTARSKYSIAATSIIGLLEKEWHYGGMFRNQNLRDVVSNIVLTNGLFSDDYSLVASDSMTAAYNSIEYDGNLAYLKVFGWLKPSKKREALYQLLFSLGLHIKRKSNGNVLICGLSTTIDSNIADNDIYNTGSIERVEKVKSITITEHTFTDQIKPQIVFDNAGDAKPDDAYVINFEKAPLSETPQAENGLTILASNCNAAIVTGAGTVKARTYLHTTQDISKQISNDLDGTELKVQDATMITSMNSHKIFERLLSYYSSDKQIIKNSIILRGQSCGNKYGFLGPFSERINAHLQKITVTASGTTKADCEFVQGYTPIAPGIDFTHSTILTGSGTWSTPSSANRLRVIIIGGGQGGGGGCQGEDGEWHKRDMDYKEVRGNPARGGLAGQGGRGGKIFIVDIESPASSYNYSAGTGGAGGNANYATWNEPTVGTLGTDSTFGSYSSANGSYQDAGYTDPFSGETYGRQAPQYENGDGDGGNGGYYRYDSSSSQLVYIEAQSRVNPFTGEYCAAGSKAEDSSGGKGGCGAGASIEHIGYNGRGFNGGMGWRSGSYADRGWPYGCGGYGGLGGGGGGAAGFLPSTATLASASGGSGGVGYYGGNGADGCIIVYY